MPQGGRWIDPRDPATQETRLTRVLNALGASAVRYDYDRSRAWIEFNLGDQAYRLAHRMKGPSERGRGPRSGTEAFVRLVDVLDIAERLTRQEVFGADTLLAGFRADAAARTPSPQACLAVLGLGQPPASIEELNAHYRSRVRRLGVGTSGYARHLLDLLDAYREARTLVPDPEATSAVVAIKAGASPPAIGPGTPTVVRSRPGR